ncbi:FadR family transcriptional regulator [bacterium]|nr:FadR family transcriptional regulator [bacterium]
MRDLLSTPIKAESLKEVFVSRFEKLILSGNLSIGEKLPSERELALQLSVSRPVVHEGLVELASKGLITMKPRVGATVNDYRKEGSPDILISLFEYQDGKLDPKILKSILSMRVVFEVETAKEAAINRTDEQIAEFEEILKKEKATDINNIEALANIDFDFHHLITMATDNMIYPLIINSMRMIYTNLSKQFFSYPGVVSKTFSFHQEIFQAIKEKNEKLAVKIMTKILKHGEEHLSLMISSKE